MSLIGKTFLVGSLITPRTRVITTDPQKDAFGGWFVWTEQVKRDPLDGKVFVNLTPRVYPIHDLPDHLAAEAFEMTRDTDTEREIL